MNHCEYNAPLTIMQDSISLTEIAFKEHSVEDRHNNLPT